jgi:undecaprenyl pyrophosphate phosphatase UppP
MSGGLVAAVTGVLAIRTFVAVLGRRAFHLFAPYCWVVGVAFLLYLRLR